MFRHIRTCTLTVVCLAMAGQADALINPALQPADLFGRYNVVLSATVESVDEESNTAVLAVRKVFAGEHTVKQFRVVAEGEDREALISAWFEGQTVVGFVGKKRRRHEDELIFYYGTRNRWQMGELTADGDWLWTGCDQAEGSPDGFGLWGTWNGQADRLAELCADLAAGRHYHPVASFEVFDRPLELAAFTADTLKGVAAHDLDGDGRIDVVAASSEGVKVLRQQDDGKFADVTTAWGLAGVAAGSVSVASVRGDGRQDLLLDGRLFLRTDTGFAASDRLATELAGDTVLSAGFIDADNDGLPDVLLSVRGQGLRLWRNTAKGPFVEITADRGLDQSINGAGCTGHVAPGDFNGDGRVDLFFAARKGILLAQDENGRFVRQRFGVYPSFKTDGQPDTARTGAAQFTTSWRSDAYNILVGTEARFVDIAPEETRGGQDVTAHGNEAADGAFRLLGGLAEDLNADGTVDILGVTCSAKQANVYLMNRGYGSYMRSEKYRHDLLPGAMGDRGAFGGVAVDIDRDGDNDLLLASVDGVLRLCRNLTFNNRDFDVGVDAKRQERALAQTYVVHVTVESPSGVIGAEVFLRDAAGRMIARRWIGSEMFTGCRGADAYSLAVRQPGTYTVTVRFSDGEERSAKVVLTGAQRLVTVPIRR